MRTCTDRRRSDGASCSAGALEREHNCGLCELNERWRYAGRQHFRDEPERTPGEARARQKPFAGNELPGKEGSAGDGPREDGNPSPPHVRISWLVLWLMWSRKTPGPPRRQGGAPRRGRENAVGALFPGPVSNSTLASVMSSLVRFRRCDREAGIQVGKCAATRRICIDECCRDRVNYHPVRDQRLYPDASTDISRLSLF